MQINNLFSSLAAAIRPTNPGQENFILNFIYLYAFNVKIIIFALAAAGIAIAMKNKKSCQNFFLCLNMSAALFLSYLLTSLLPFDFLIYYERTDYADRVLTAAGFFLLPFLTAAFYGFFEKLLRGGKTIKYSFIIFFAALITVSLYISYPRFDNYFNSSGYSAGQHDLEAVRWINENSKKENYAVLANQQVSAASLREFGFAKYYKTGGDEIFYYSIPTGGPLYQYYLDMVYKTPSRATMEKAMDLVSADRAYFVLNKYWWASPKIKEEAKMEADSWQEFGDGEVIVFKYGR